MIIVSLLLVAWFATLIMVGILLHKVLKMEKLIEDAAGFFGVLNTAASSTTEKAGAVDGNN